MLPACGQAGCEGAAYLLQRLKTDYRLSGSVIQVPCAAATFFAPALILPDDFNAQHFDVYVVKVRIKGFLPT